MSVRKLLGFLFLVGMLVSCGVLPQKNTYHATSKSVELGVVGNRKISVYKTDFDVTSIPVYKNLIKVTTVEKSFTKSIYKNYLDATKEKKGIHKVNYIDSLEVKPTYIDLILEDKVAVIKALNQEENESVFKYVKNIPEAKLVSALRMVSTPEVKKQLQQADAMYVKTNNQKNQKVYLFNKEKQIGVLDISKTTIFGYQVSSFCWEITEREKIKLATLLNEGENCTSNTKRNPKKLEKELIDRRLKF
ncbi:conserved protein of unknown function [Tenacibaculum sp. 190524A02b]|uniref:hypothetical protein n=1 Tax=Tenacibaculum vairaonense TaxID=3137860 RepID=UPI0032B24DC0